MASTKKIKKYKPIINKQSFYEMSNLTPDDTGLPFVIWISPMSGKEGHWARVKIEYEGKYYPLSIGKNPEWKVKSHIKIPFSSKQVKAIKEFIIKNEKILIDYWKSQGKMSMKVVLNSIEKI